jgi:hypothetical protein
MSCAAFGSASATPAATVIPQPSAIGELDIGDPYHPCSASAAAATAAIGLSGFAPFSASCGYPWTRLNASTRSAWANPTAAARPSYRNTLCTARAGVTACPAWANCAGRTARSSRGLTASFCDCFPALSADQGRYVDV